jgi:5'-3' exoribonuclease 1
MPSLEAQPLVEGPLHISRSMIYSQDIRRCTEYRGSTCTMNSCLNLTNPQFIVSTAPTPPTRVTPVHLANAYGNKSGTATPPNGRGRGQGTPRIMANPTRGRRGSPGVNGGPPNSQPQPAVVNLFHSARGGHGFRGRGPVMFAGGRGGGRGIQHPISVLQNGRGNAQPAPQSTPMVQNVNAPTPRGRGNAQPVPQSTPVVQNGNAQRGRGVAQRGRANGEAGPARGRGNRGGRGGGSPTHRRVSSSGATVPS